MSNDRYSIQLKKTKKFLNVSRRFVDTIMSKYKAIYQKEKAMSDADGLNYSDEEISRNTMLQIQPLLEEQDRVTNEYLVGE